MMNIDLNSPIDVREAGMQAVVDALGPVGFARFIQQFERGYGDYTKEKYENESLSFEEIKKKLSDRRSA